MDKKQVTSVKWIIGDDQILRPEIHVENLILKLDSFQEARDMEFSIGDYALIENNEIVGFDYRKVSGFLDTPERCPKCKQPLVIDNGNLKCVNSLCPISVTKFITRLVLFSGLRQRDFLETFRKKETRTIYEYLKDANLVSIGDFFERGNKGLGVCWRRVQSIKEINLANLLSLLPYDYWINTMGTASIFGTVENFLCGTQREFMAAPTLSYEKRIAFMCDSIRFRPLIIEFQKFYEIKPVEKKEGILNNVNVCIIGCKKFNEYEQIVKKIKEFGGVPRTVYDISNDLIIYDTKGLSDDYKSYIKNFSGKKIKIRDFCKFIEIKLTENKKCQKKSF